jgi:hypothetical protein
MEATEKCVKTTMVKKRVNLFIYNIFPNGEGALPIGKPEKGLSR